jgi:tol-pal system protein YbgF
MRRSPRFLFLALITAAALLASPVVEASPSRAAREEAEQERREAQAEARLRDSSRRMAEVLIQEEMARKERLARRDQAEAQAAAEKVAVQHAATQQADGAVGDSGLDAVFGRNERLTAPTGSQDRYYMPESIPPAGSAGAAAGYESAGAATGYAAPATSAPPSGVGAAGGAAAGTSAGMGAATGYEAPTTVDPGQPGPAGQPMPGSGSQASPPRGAGAPQPHGTPQAGGTANLELFHSGYSNYSKGDFVAARRSFAAFLAANPGHELADSAQYWLGQCAAAEGDYARALADYRRVIESFPFGDKVPDALLKSGEALMELGREAEARRTWKELAREFPDTGAGRRAREHLGEGSDMASAGAL